MVAGTCARGAKGLIWKAAVAAIKAQGRYGRLHALRPEHGPRGPTAIVGKARGHRRRRLRRPGGAPSRCARAREITVIEEAKKARQRHWHHRQEPHHQSREVPRASSSCPSRSSWRSRRRGARVPERPRPARRPSSSAIPCSPRSAFEQKHRPLRQDRQGSSRTPSSSATPRPPEGKVYRTLEATKGGYEAGMAF